MSVSEQVKTSHVPRARDLVAPHDTDPIFVSFASCLDPELGSTIGDVDGPDSRGVCWARAQIKSTTGPRRARFTSGHFLFASGSLVSEVPYDPELSFIGEEITPSVRVSQRYDLFHPAESIVWHEYTRNDFETNGKRTDNNFATKGKRTDNKLAERRIFSCIALAPFAPIMARGGDPWPRKRTSD